MTIGATLLFVIDLATDHYSPMIKSQDLMQGRSLL